MPYREFDPTLSDVIPLARELEIARNASCIEDVDEALHAIGPTLGPAGIQSEFNDIYAEVSHEVAEAKRRGEFVRPDLVDANSPIFLGKYTHPLEKVVDFVRYHQTGHGNPNALYEMKDCWWLTLPLSDPRIAAARRGQRTALGVSSHILADLGPSMVHTKPGQDYYPDYMDIVTGALNGVITRRIAEQIPAHSAAYGVLIPAVSAGIKVMRRKSWWDYEQLIKMPETSRPAFERGLDQQATALNRIIRTIGPSTLAALAHTEGLQTISDLRAEKIERIRLGLPLALQKVVDLSSKFRR